MIDEWESRVVSEHLASGRNGGKTNHYWMVKNMMGMLMEDLTNKWNEAMDMAQSMWTYLNQTDEHMIKLETNFNWRHYTIFCNDDETMGGRNTEHRGMVGRHLQ